MITLTNGAQTVNLPEDLYWSDEFDWTVVERSATRSLTGARIVQEGVKSGGRPITLAPQDEFSAWTDRATLDTVNGWANTAGLQLTLTLRGTARTVQIDSVEARPIVHYSDVLTTDAYLATFRFTEV